MQSTFSSNLTDNHKMSSWTACHGPDHYYEALAIEAVVTSNYSFVSSSNINIEGYIFKNDINSFMKPIAYNDDSCGSNQFQLTVELQANAKYILVVTTLQPKLAGEFTVRVFGSNNITFKSISKC